MKGIEMNLKKISGSSRGAGYGIALGALLHAAWRGVVAFLVPGDFDRRLLRGR